MPRIIPIKDLKNTAEISEMCRSSAEPIFITKNGYGDMVLMSIETYENYYDKGKIYQDLETSEKQIQEGKVRDAKSSLKALKDRYGI